MFSHSENDLQMLGLSHEFSTNGGYILGSLATDWLKETHALSSDPSFILNTPH